MANNTGKTVATLLIGAAVGAAVGYVLATDKDTRAETVDKLRERFNSLQDNMKKRFAKKGQDLEEEIYNA
jgi:gas vesicle protein